MSSAIWDWCAILTGLRSAEGIFVPLYWALPAHVSLFFGGTPLLPETVFAVLVAISVAAVAVFLWNRTWLWLCLACVIWGALFADTPYVLLVPPLLLLLWQLPLAVMRAFGFMPSGELPCLRGKWCAAVFVLSLVLFGSANLVRFRASYPRGYLRRAVAAVRWDGLPWLRDASRMDALLDAYVRELAREGAGKKWIFTDGLCDSGIELAAHGRLRAVSLVGGALNESAARRKGFANGEDLFALSTGAAQLLRAWAVDRPENLTNAVFQCGFSFLEQVAGNRVEPCGLVIRATGCGKMPHLRRGGIPAAPSGEDETFSSVRDLGERIVAFRTEGGSDFGVGRARSVRFGAMQWRVARAIRREAQLLDRAGRLGEAQKAVALSERLDELNPFAHGRAGEADPTDLRAINALSPREGLAFALKRADFPLACRYAKPILESDPANPAANFAMAMGHFKMREYALARGFFEKALAARPDDPALLNNLALTLLELGELEAAHEKASAAQKLKPDSSAIRDTLLQIDRRRNAVE